MNRNSTSARDRLLVLLPLIRRHTVRLSSQYGGIIKADDLEQEVLLALLLNRQILKEKDTRIILGYAIKTAKNKLISRLRKVNLYREVQLDSGYLEQIGDPRKEPSDFERREQWNRIIEPALKKLSYPQRKLITMTYLEGMPLNKTAKKMGITENACYQLHRRALQSLRKTIKRGKSG